MNHLITTRLPILLAGLIQGVAMLALHQVLGSRGLQAADLAWATPLYALALTGPTTFNLLRGEFSEAQSLTGASMAALAITLTAVWFGWSSIPMSGLETSGSSWYADLFVFGLSSLIAWFIALPFLQGGLRSGGPRYPYPGLFDDAWRNTLLVANCVVFTGGFWLLLALWAGLFSVLKISFFADLFSSPFFAYPATSLVISFAVTLEGYEASTLTSLRRYLLNVQTRLLPLAALIVLLYLAALPFAGLQPLWDTGYATPLMLCLQIAMITLTNAAWQDGLQPAPFSRPVQGLVRAALALLPVLAALCVWSLSLRIAQYGWTVDRVWAAVLVFVCSLYGLAYAISSLGHAWLPTLGTFNAGIAQILVATLLAIHTPLLDPQRISASSQLARLLSGQSDPEHFDYSYLRFSLGRAGDSALQHLAVLTNHAEAATISRKAKEALARRARYGGPTPDKGEIPNKLKAYPAGTPIAPAFIDYLSKRLEKDKDRRDYFISSLRGHADIPLLAIDLGEGEGQEYVLLSPPFPVFSGEHQEWRQIGQIDFGGGAPTETEIEKSLQNGEFSVQTRQWNDLKLGARLGGVLLRQNRPPE